ncbi:MAG: TetR/AcrR family transcriptional regulator [Actinomycetota bacterium]
MLENATPKTKHPGGRPPEFDRSEVLTAALMTFWTKGFKATTVGDLETATGLDRSSLYNAFGNKTGLYEAAGELYLAMSGEQLFSVLHDGTEGVEDVLRFIDTLSTSYRAGQPRGCFVVNDMGSVEEYEATHRYFEVLGTGFSAALSRAADLGEMHPGSVDQRAQFLTAAFIGINLTHRNRADAEIAHTMMDGVRTEVVGWLDA